MTMMHALLRAYTVFLGCALLATQATGAETADDAYRENHADLRHYAKLYGNAAGNDLANEIVGRMQSAGISFDPDVTRERCKGAVAKLLNQKTVVPMTRFDEGHDVEFVSVGSPVERRFTLELPAGIHWSEDVEITFKADPAASRSGHPSLPDKMYLWMS